MTYLHMIISFFRTSENANEKLTVKSRYHKFVVDGRGVLITHYTRDVRFPKLIQHIEEYYFLNQ